MAGLTISQVAERSGFTSSALRFYEQAGLVRPDRSPAGYRLYDEGHLEMLAFIGRAKGFGLTLDEIAELLVLLDQDRCAPVQGRLADLIADKIDGAQVRIAELVTFTAELQRVAAGLAGSTPDGPCDDTCGCTSDTDSADRTDHANDGPHPGRVGVALGARAEPGDEPVACTLSHDQVPGRIDDWQEMVARATVREAMDGGVRLRFGPDVDVAALATLAAAEQSCCRFFTFGITIDGAGVAFEITAPDDAQPVVEAMFGVAP